MLSCSPLLRATTRLGAALCAILAGATAARAQTEAGIARDARTQQPLACQHVALVDSAGRAVRHTVTDSMGRFMLDAPAAGLYRVRFESFGWEPLAGPLDTLKDGDFKQRAYPVAFTNVLVPSRPLDSLTWAQANVNKRLDKAAVDSMFAPGRRFSEWKRSLEETSAWKSRRVEGGVDLRYPGGMLERGTEGSVVVRFVVDSTGRARRDSWTVLEASHDDFAQAFRRILDARWHPSTNEGRPVCDVVQHYVRFELDRRDPENTMAHVTVMNE